MYYFGHHIHNYTRGTIAVLLDRFSDTLALVTIILCIAIFQKFMFSIFIYVLAAVMVSMMIAYFLFPNLYSYWNHYLICGSANKKRLYILKLLAYANRAYRECRKLVQGRIILLYLISFFAWMLELGGVYFTFIRSKSWLEEDGLLCYLEASCGLNESLYQQGFLIVSVLVLLGSLCLIYLYQTERRKRV